MKPKFTIFFILISFVSSAQNSNDTLRFMITDCDTLKFQKIDIEKEKDDIVLFIKDFGSQTDSVKIQDYILFPFFTAMHTCDPFYPASWYSMPKTDNIILDEMPRYFHNLIGNGQDYDSLKMSAARKHLNCKNPVYPYEYFYRHSIAFKDSIDKMNMTVMQFFFLDPKNRTDYCSWFISAYKFPVFQSIDLHPEFIQFTKMSIGVKGKILPFINVGVGILKVNNEFKVISLSYPYN